ncbi:probable ATP-dependent RNA helicase DDX58 isoform X1 [Tachysurus fulvidraco]|uniref:probable ATP-dependent RNA helicase DDX58 isoform X1 n=2 Tax=Tachysurus fulvidraco TaxID=1234273 RepID=UPI001FED3570|nr:probable ATP-dependent RNA helicase DDX58 isoform X1 [Tachysurus fulvidraco]
MAATQILLDKMMELDTVGWFQGFLDILKASEYTGLHMAISMWDFTELESLCSHRNLLDQVEMSITKNMKPRELLPHMSDCLTQRECEEIRAVEEQKGCVAASERLVETLRHCDKANWFKVFKLALENCNQNLALQLLEPDENGNCVQKFDENDAGMAVCIEYREDGESDNLMSSNSETEQCVKGAEEGAASVCERRTEKKLRKYQKELATAAYNGLNTIICAPTGCGKTIVAVAICEHHLKKYPEKAKVVFMATKVEVYEQQLKLFKEHFSEDPNIKVEGVCGEMGDVNLPTLVSSNDVLLMTPQILVNALQRGDVASLDTFTLLLLDECHNTTGKHPYNNIMSQYIDTKHHRGTNSLPQVVGFTASVGIKSFKNVVEAENNICQLCANLDARVITTVTENIDELRSFVHTPEKEFFQVNPCKSDPFILIIKNIMKNIEQLAKGVYPIDNVSQVQRGDYGTQMYEQWIVDVQKRCRLLQFTDHEEERKVCRALYTYTEHLRKYNDALIINDDARTKDALDFMESFIKDINNASPDPTERKLIDLYHVQHEQLRHLAAEGEQNPKLQELKYILDEEYRNNDQTRTVLFVRTRALAEALKNWIDETDSLKFLKPGVLIGRGRKSQLAGSGMTLTGQKGVLDSFKSSDQSKILIATSVADEGIDIPQCNLVLMYEYVGNVVKMVQVRGRGRAQGSRCFLISSRQERIQKEKQNMEREKLVEKAIKLLQDSPDHMCAKVDRFQREDVARRALANPNDEKTQIDGSYHFLCGKCKKFVCLSDDLRVLQGSHHIVLDKSIFQRCSTKPHRKIATFDNITKKEKMFCSECQQDWGIIASYMNIQDLPVLKIESFIIKDLATNEQQYFRKWRDVTFRMRAFDVTEKMFEKWEPRT